ncbi:flavin reductase family protein [Granulicoccus sp. GXG6511]|uniref:flavin reductase family protein n=1 Tax=Granulicoccus sp. GXG6511 TaxID=3381351 RepID=UPI003D7E0F3B
MSGVIGPPASAEQLRNVMAQAPAAVAVVTTRTAGVPHGTTVSSFVSVSLDPPTMLVSLDNTSELLSQLEPGSRIGVNILAHYQADAAAHFARKNKGDPPIGSELTDDEPPRVLGCLAWIALTATELITVHDHTLVIGTVNTTDTTQVPDLPLLYWQRAYGTPKSAA